MPTPSRPATEDGPEQAAADAERALLDQLLTDSRLYKQSKDYKELLDFVVRLRNFAPFNAMLLQVQKPGLSYAASARDWAERFGRKPKDGARPLLILWPFGPVALVYDVLDTVGEPLPMDVAAFFARGSISSEKIQGFIPLLGRKRIECCWLDAGDQKAGSIRLVSRAQKQKEYSHYRMLVNRNHTAAEVLVYVEMTWSEGTGDDFHGVPGTLRSKMTGTTPAQGKPVPRARPMAAKQTAGLSGTPAAWGHGLDAEHPAAIAVTCSAIGCGGGGRLRARYSGGRGGRPPAFFRRRSPAREPRAAAEATSPPLEGRKAPGVAVDERARKRTPL